MVPMFFPMIPTLIGSVVGALVSGPLGTTVLRGVLAGGLLGGAGSVAMQQRARGPVTLPVRGIQGPSSCPPGMMLDGNMPSKCVPWPLLAGSPQGGAITGGLILPDGQLVTPPSTPGDLHAQQEAAKLADWSRASTTTKEAERKAVELALLEEIAQATPEQLLTMI